MPSTGTSFLRNLGTCLSLLHAQICTQGGALSPPSAKEYEELRCCRALDNGGRKISKENSCPEALMRTGILLCLFHLCPARSEICTPPSLPAKIQPAGPSRVSLGAVGEATVFVFSHLWV